MELTRAGLTAAQLTGNLGFRLATATAARRLRRRRAAATVHVEVAAAQRLQSGAMLGRVRPQCPVLCEVPVFTRPLIGSPIVFFRLLDRLPDHFARHCLCPERTLSLHLLRTQVRAPAPGHDWNH